MRREVRRACLSARQKQLLALMQELNFGRIENLQVRGGQPVLEPAPRLIRTLKMGAENGPRPELLHDDFALRKEQVEALEHIAQLDDCTVRTIEVRHGIPLKMEVEETARV